MRLLRSLPGALPNLAQTAFGAIPGAGTVANVTDRLRRIVSSGEGGQLERSSLRAPRTSFNGRVSLHRRFVFGQLPLDEVKALKHEHGVTVTSTAALFTRGGDRENGRSR